MAEIPQMTPRQWRLVDFVQGIVAQGKSFALVLLVHGASSQGPRKAVLQMIVIVLEVHYCPSAGIMQPWPIREGRVGRGLIGSPCAL